MEPEDTNKFTVRGSLAEGKWLIYNGKDAWVRKDLTAGGGPVNGSYDSYYYDSREEAETTLIAAKIAGII